MKMYQAIDEQICIKQFAPELVEGWFATTKEALEAMDAPVVKESLTTAEEPKKRGRPAKVSR